MYFGLFTSLGLVLLVIFQSSNALKCRRCNKEEFCNNNDLTKCRYGLALDVCRCCDVCAKGPGDTCGGPFELGGRCGDNLICKKKSRNLGDRFNEVGTCVEVNQPEYR